jgi:thiol-disulfide isomerase/thioredoxin
MNKMIIFFCCLIALFVCKEAYPSEKDVLIIDENNFGLALREFKYLLILFYSTDDPNCQEFIPEYEKIASILKKDNYVLAKIDSDKSPQIIRHFNVQIFPSIMLLKKTVPIDYKGEKKQEQIISWLKEQTKKEYRILGTKEELEEFKKQHDLCLIFFGKNDKIRNEIDLAERKMDDIPMGIVNSEELIKENAKSEDKKEYFILFTKFDEQKYYLHDLKSEKIIDFYNLYSTPKVIDFAAQTSPVHFNKRFPSLVFFTSKQIKNWTESKGLLTIIWPKVNR